MRLKGISRSRNVEDRRGQGRGRAGGAVGGLGIGAVLAVLAIGWATGIDVMPLLQGSAVSEQSSGGPLSETDAREGAFAAQVLATT